MVRVTTEQYLFKCDGCCTVKALAGTWAGVEETVIFCAGCDDNTKHVNMHIVGVTEEEK